MPLLRKWDAATYEAIPADSDQVSEGALRIRNTRTDVRERLAAGGHVMTMDANSQTYDGLHAVNADSSGAFRIFRSNKTDALFTTSDTTATFQGTGGSALTVVVKPDGTTARLTVASAAVTAAAPTTIANAGVSLTLTRSDSGNVLSATANSISVCDIGDTTTQFTTGGSQRLLISNTAVQAPTAGSPFKDSAGNQLISTSGKQKFMLPLVLARTGGTDGPNVDHFSLAFPQGLTSFTIKEVTVTMNDPATAGGPKQNISGGPMTFVVSRSSPTYVADQMTTSPKTASTTLGTVSINNNSWGARITSFATSTLSSGDTLQISQTAGGGTPGSYTFMLYFESSGTLVV